LEGSETKSILIIEDEKDIIDLIAYHLRQSSFSVMKAMDGPTGLETAKKGEIPGTGGDRPWALHR
jgi:DNA-binding response OmpR family regulator